MMQANFFGTSRELVICCDIFGDKRHKMSPTQSLEVTQTVVNCVKMQRFSKQPHGALSKDDVDGSEKVV